ncbi:sugar ABC transporter substrate-binding protein [Murimonas intestini]|uniref:sugar ABC transporter substrate-binding protein n=1 Tax=Murimonas intestini TaxID=1337051 RepID=UPI0011DD8899|nr:substrate-binding domain-containing protein [Murimonas intestini]
MKKNRKLFILLEAFLAVLVIAAVLIMLWGKNGKDRYKVSVIIQNSDDNQWAAFKYGLRMAAEDKGIEMFVVSTGGALTVEEEKSAIEWEIDNGADAVIVQPVPSPDAEEMLKKIENKVPVMLVGYTASGNKDASRLPATGPDNYAMGAALAEELLKDYNGNIKGKTLGILTETTDSPAVVSRKKGFTDTLKNTGVEISWSVSGVFDGNEEDSPGNQPKVDFVIALDDNSLTTAGSYSAANNLHGALVYGIGNSTEAVYYLDMGFAECLVVPDEFNVGYQSLTEIWEKLGHYFSSLQNITVSHTVLRRDTLFLKENQEILFTMSQ